MFFPNDYQFLANSRCTGEPQVDTIVRLSALLREAFELKEWTSAMPTPLTREYVAQEIESSRKQVRRRPDSNAAMTFAMASANAELRVIINTGSRPLTPTDADAFNILFNGDFKKPDPKYWLQILELLQPFMAEVGYCKNKSRVETMDRIHRNLLSRPSALLGLGYFTERVLTKLGGKAHVLKTPAHRTREFLDGVLIELVPGYYLDPNNPEHLKIQDAAMRHMGIDD